jgi:hypothetical protein
MKLTKGCENGVVGGATPELVVVEPDIRPRQGVNFTNILWADFFNFFVAFLYSHSQFSFVFFVLRVW